MPTITVKLDKKRADRLAPGREPQNPEISGDPCVDYRAGPIETGDGLIDWVDAALGKGLGWQEEAVSRPALLDSSFPSISNGNRSRRRRAWRRFLPSLRGRPLVVSIVSVEEILRCRR